MTWTLTVLSIVGVVLNIYKEPACFWIWAGTNVAWAVVDWRKGIPSQAALFVVYAALAVWGIVAWGQ